jgi:hypothetical protein
MNNLSKNWLNARGYEIKFDKKGNVNEDKEEIVNYWLSNDTITFNHYIGGGIIGKYDVYRDSTYGYDTLHAKTFFSNFKIEKITTDSLILQPLDSVAVDYTWHSTRMFQVIPEESKYIKLRLFDAGLVYETIRYDSVHMKIYINGHFEKWEKNFTIYPSLNCRYKKSITNYNDGKKEDILRTFNLSELEKEEFDHLLNSSGINFFSKKIRNRHLTHAVYCDLNVYVGSKRIQINQPRLFYPESIEKVIYFFYELEKEE